MVQATEVTKPEAAQTAASGKKMMGANGGEIPAELKARYEAAGQGHVFKWVGELGTEELAKFIKQLAEVNVDKLLQDFQKAKQEATKTTTRLQPAPLRSDDVIRASGEKKDLGKKYWDAGLKAIGEGQVAVITLAGGQGTRLGSAAPKGCYDIGLPSRRSLFELQALRIRRVAKLAGTDKTILPWYIMTSEATDAPTRSFFAKHQYWGIPKERVKFFKQGQLPALTEEGKLILADKSSLALSPNGNGGIYEALLKEGILEDMKRAGIKAVHMYCVDNALVKVADPTFLGGCLLNQTDCAAKSIERTDPQESVGVFCRRQGDGKMMVAEYSELDAAIASQTVPDKDGRPTGKLLLDHANIANHFFTLSFLERVATSTLPMHLAHKKIPALGPDGKPLAKAPMGFKMEAFIFDVLELSQHPMVYQGVREEEFAPLKNAPGATRDAPEHCRKMLLDLHQSWLKQAGKTELLGKEIEISPLDSYGGEDLKSFKLK